MSYKIWAIYGCFSSTPAGKLLHHILMNELDLPPPEIVRKGGDLKKMKLTEHEQTVNKILKLGLELLKHSSAVSPSACFLPFPCTQSVQEVR